MDIFLIYGYFLNNFFLQCLIALAIFERRVIYYNREFIYYTLNARGCRSFFLYLNIGVQFYREAYSDT